MGWDEYIWVLSLSPLPLTSLPEHLHSSRHQQRRSESEEVEHCFPVARYTCVPYPYPYLGHHFTVACTIYCGRQWPSIDISHNLFWPAMTIDGRGSPSIVFDHIYRSTISPVYCHRQHLSIDTFHNILPQTIYIDKFPPSSTVEAIDYCCVHCPEYALLHHDICSFLFFAPYLVPVFIHPLRLPPSK